MNTEITKHDPAGLARIENPDTPLRIDDVRMLADETTLIVDSVTQCFNNLTTTYKEVAIVAAQVEMETRRLDHALDCLMVKAQRDRDIYRDTIPLLDKNFTALQARMDRLMDRAMDLICEDVSDASLARQEAFMNLIETTNNSINNLIMKLMPNH